MLKQVLVPVSAVLPVTPPIRNTMRVVMLRVQLHVLTGVMLQPGHLRIDLVVRVVVVPAVILCVTGCVVNSRLVEPIVLGIVLISVRMVADSAILYVVMLVKRPVRTHVLVIVKKAAEVRIPQVAVVVMAVPVVLAAPRTAVSVPVVITLHQYRLNHLVVAVLACPVAVATVVLGVALPVARQLVLNPSVQMSATKRLV